MAAPFPQPTSGSPAEGETAPLSRRVRAHRAAILDLLAEHGPLTPTDIRRRVGGSSSATAALHGLEAEGLVVSGRAETPDGPCRYYRLAEPCDTEQHPSNTADTKEG